MLLIVWLLGVLPMLADALHAQVAGALQVLTLGFLFTLAVNGVIALVLWAVERLVIQVQRP